MPRRKPAKAPDGDRSPWPVFLTVHAVLLGRIEERLREAELPEIGWYDVLWALERAPEQRLRMHELADRAVISRTNLTRLTDRLETAGFVERVRDREDRRGAFAVLTPAGRAMRRRMWPVYAAAIEELFDRHLTARERRLMRDWLTRVLQAARTGQVED